MKLSGKILLVIFLILLPLFSFTGCNTPPPSNTGNSINPPVSEENNEVEQQNAETAPGFARAELHTGKNMQIPADITGSKTALVFFSRT